LSRGLFMLTKRRAWQAAVALDDSHCGVH
jgi:hypothetical protein